eukprot:202645_1
MLMQKLIVIPKKFKVIKNANEVDVNQKNDAGEMYWCGHCNDYYCSVHKSDHKLNMTKCKGIGNEWVIEGKYLYKGKCDFQKMTQSCQIKCGKYVETYCNHCKQWYCKLHSQKHTPFTAFTKCNGPKNGEVIDVDKKGDKGIYAGGDSCCVIL